jgi:putative FmdB family regulatory protein
MPLYEYLCTSCGHRFERIRKFSDPPLTECPLCGGAVEKQISSPAIKFKGAGWYVNDYAKSGTAGKSESSKSESSASSDEGSKPAADSAKTETTKTETAAPKPAPATDKK